MPVKMCTSEFIEKAKAVHGDEYDYSCSIYAGSKEQINVLHNKCGRIFSCKPNNHLMGSRCSHCFQKVALSKDEFSRRAKAIHGSKYDYSDVEYISNKNKVKIKCNSCNSFFHQKPNSHLRGDGCIICSGRARLTTDDFIRKSKMKHGDSFDYSQVIYKRTHDKVTIKCNTCKLVFEQYANNHMAGDGCPSCKADKSGWGRSKFINKCKEKGVNGTLYLIKIIEDDGSAFYKIGITSNSIRVRFRKNMMPYEYEIIGLMHGDPEWIWDKENELKLNIKNKRYSPKIKFGGSTYECFGEITQEIIDYFKV